MKCFICGREGVIAKEGHAACPTCNGEYDYPHQAKGQCVFQWLKNIFNAQANKTELDLTVDAYDRLLAIHKQLEVNYDAVIHKRDSLIEEYRLAIPKTIGYCECGRPLMYTSVSTAMASPQEFLVMKRGPEGIVIKGEKENENNSSR